MLNILVTGSNGQLGSELRKRKDLLQADIDFTDVAELDITNSDAVMAFPGNKTYHYIINCAAYTAVDKAEGDQENARKINVEAVGNLARLATAHQACLIHVSTDYVFAGDNHVPYVESDPVNPMSVYGQTKADGEREAMKTPQSVIIRTSWLYSSFGNNFVKTIARLASEREELKVIFDQVGTPTFAGDLAEAIIQIVTYQQKNELHPGIYHFSDEGVCSWYDFAVEIAELTHAKAKITPIETKDYPSVTPRPWYSVLNKSKIKTTFGLSIPYWKDSLKYCLKELNL